MTDLFVKTKSNKHRILDYIKIKQEARNSEIQSFGSNNFINEPLRYVRTLKNDGCVRKLTKEDKLFRYGRTVEDVIVFVRDL